MMKRLHNDEGGWVLATAVVLMTVMLTIGILALQLVDSDGHRTREQRETESALNVDEGTLYAQSLILAQHWPSATSHTYAVTSCSSTPPVGGQPAGCPSPQNLAGTGSAANFKNVDEVSKTTWRTKVRDNDGPLASAYDPTQADLPQTGSKGTCPGPCTYDFNGDNEVWVQAQTFVHGHSRNVVARMRLEKLQENTPQTAVTAGAISITNNGNHGGTPIIDATGSQVLVRCSSGDSSCINANEGQVAPSTPQPLQAGATPPPNMMTATQLARMKARAIADGHYFSGCPGQGPSAYENGYDLSGAVVWVEGCNNPPNFSNRVPTTSCPTAPSGMSQSCVNSELNPGILIWHCGRADFQGNFTYRGVLYMVNDSDGSCPSTLPQQVGDYTCSSSPNADSSRDILNTNGGFAVWGAVAVDGPACLKVGSNNLQITYDGRVFDSVQSYGTVGLVQNTWRELQPDSFTGS